MATPTANDPRRQHGPEHLQNFPIIQSVGLTAGPGSTQIHGKLNGVPSTTFGLDFYSNPACSNFPREFLEGQTYLGSSEVTTDGSGNASIDVTLPVVTEVGARISATATDPAGNTSEFSQRIIFSINPTSSGWGTAFTTSGTDFADPTTITVGGTRRRRHVHGRPHASRHHARVRSRHGPGRRGHDTGHHDGHAYQGLGGELPGRTGSAPVLRVRHQARLQRHHRGRGRRQLRRGPADAAPADGGLPSEGQARSLLHATSCAGTFGDVPCPSTFADWIEALASEGVSGGCGGGNFCPANPVRRDQMAPFLLKAKHGSSYTPPTCTGMFSDVPCPSLFADWIEQLLAESVTGGCGGSNYCPQNSATRGQMAAFLSITFNLQ
jgi:hypothetical protein